MEAWQFAFKKQPDLNKVTQKERLFRPGIDMDIATLNWVAHVRIKLNFSVIFFQSFTSVSLCEKSYGFKPAKQKL